MKIRKMIVVQMIMMLLFYATAAADINLNRMLVESMNAFYEDEATVEHPVYMTRFTLGAEQLMALTLGEGMVNLGELEVIEDEQLAGRWLYFAEHNRSGKMLDSFVVLSQRWKQDWMWNAFEAGERALWRLQDLMQFIVNEHNGYEGVYYEPRFMENQDSELIMYKIPLGESGYLPYSRRSYEGLAEGSNGEFSIVGLDSAYTVGENEYFKWELYPFVIVDNEGYGFENAFYIYYRQVLSLETIGGDPEVEQIEEYIIADQNKVAAIFAQMINSTPNLSSTDREWMAGLIQYTEALSELMDEERNALLPVDEGATVEEKTDLPKEESDFTSRVLSDGTIEITGYTGDQTRVVIPHVINGKKVVSIGEEAFYSYESLESIIIPKGIVSIGDRAFYGCTNLQSVIIPDGVERIGVAAFIWCFKLRDATIPRSVVDIGYNAFYGCNSLKIYGGKGSAAEKLAEELGISFVSDATTSTPKMTPKPIQTSTPKPAVALKTLSERPTGLEIKRVSIGSTDKNGDWAGRMGDSVSYSSLRDGHTMAYYIELYNAGMDYIDINLSLYVDGEYRGYWEPSRIPYKYTWTYWMWFDEDEIGTHTVQWCLDDQVLFEKKLTITP